MWNDIGWYGLKGPTTSATDKILDWNTAKDKMWNDIGWYGLKGPTTSATDISLIYNKNYIKSSGTQNRTEQNRTEIYYDLDIYSLSSYYTNIATMQAIT